MGWIAGGDLGKITVLYRMQSILCGSCLELRRLESKVKY